MEEGKLHLHFYGVGTYQGETVPGEGVAGFMGQILREGGITNPTILLDSGETIYGCECWWGSFEVVLKKYGLNDDLSPKDSSTAEIHFESITEARAES